MQQASETLITIDPEFRAMIPPLRPEEREQLEANIKAEGCRDPLVVWGERAILLDGHNRHEICQALGIDFETVVVDLPDRDAAADWIDANQLGRRNLTPDQYSLLRGRRYNRVKHARGGNREPKGQNVPLENTASKLAKEHGVDERTIKRDGQFASAVEKVKRVDPAIESKVVSGKAPARGLIVEAAKQIDKVEREAKQEAATPLLGSRKDREAAEVWEKAKGEAEAILQGKRGTIAQAKREVARQEKRAELDAKAKAAAKFVIDDPTWDIREGDCVDVLAGVERGSARLVFADPPYNIGINYGDHHDDDMPADAYQRWCVEWMTEVHRTLTDDGSFWLLANHEWAYVLANECVETIGFHLRQWLTWYESFGVNCASKFNRCSRALLWFTKDRERFVFHPEAVNRPSDRQIKYGDKRADPGGKLWDDVWGINPPIPRLVDNNAERLPDFPTQLPLALLRPIVECASDAGDLVIDPFNGSGTTGEACIRLGRRYVGIEKGRRFAEAAEKRLMAVWGEVCRETV